MSRASEEKVKDDEAEVDFNSDPERGMSQEQQVDKKHSTLIPQPSDDPRDPLNWSMLKKISIFTILIFSTFTGIATAVANVLATPEQAKTWHTTSTRAAYSVSAVLGGIVIGSILPVPLVRVFGVMSCCFWSMVFLAITSIWSAVSTEATSYGSFVASSWPVPPSPATSSSSLAGRMGCSANRPLAHKELPDSWLGRRRALFLPGTRVTPANSVKSIPKSLKAVVAIGFSPVTVLCGIFSTFAYGWYIMAGVQLPLILQLPVSQGGYKFAPLEVANFYFAAWIGAILGVKRNGGVWHGEYRLYPSWIPGLIVGPIGYGVFGAAVQSHWHWIVVAVGECMLVFSAVASLPPTVNYIIEIWKHSSDPQEVGAALNVWRIGLAVAVQFFYEPWTKKIGINWVWGTASFLALFGFACIVLCMWKGPWLRKFDLLDDEEDPNATGKDQQTESGDPK
ncbi:hypothetical protein BDY17DRAFT_351323 [Neohortaea acidophila]|uniref:Major facilitator superfamily domain-containing protein n=1 Tax=Neohortaea acidophila TaxID=245834 RepID=A0A6A6Q202_9PEZI|nr:uncharacterized protein BDY17DRAFT_351323 [Neohortaea acidophila]KAF2486420.1 hypothetical protein BDY17DRAFT_351323 [Neohortaea acidophila]